MPSSIPNTNSHLAVVDNDVALLEIDPDGWVVEVAEGFWVRGELLSPSRNLLMRLVLPEFWLPTMMRLTFSRRSSPFFIAQLLLISINSYPKRVILILNLIRISGCSSDTSTSRCSLSSAPPGPRASADTRLHPRFVSLRFVFTHSANYSSLHFCCFSWSNMEKRRSAVQA